MVQLKAAPAARVAAVAHAREVDEQVAAMWDAYWEAMKPVTVAQKVIAEAKKDIKRRSTNYYGSKVDRKAEFEASADYQWYLGKIAKAEETIAETVEAAKPLAAAANEFDKANYEGWNRFFLVQHIHRSQHCSSFREGTRIGWLPKVSGLTEAEAVAEYGAVMCTICFPSAPVEWTGGQLKAAGVCEGSGTSVYNGLDSRHGFYSGNWATCPNCGKHVGISGSAVRIPKHKPMEATK